MTTDLAELHHQVAFGRSGGKIIWQPRIGCWYTDKLFAGEALPTPYTGMTIPEIYRSLGCSARLYEYNRCYVKIEHPAVRFWERDLVETHVETIIDTPVGRQTEIVRKTDSSARRIREKWFIETEQDFRIATWRAENTTWSWDQARYEQLRREVGDLGAPTMYLPRMNIQSLYINDMGVQPAIYATYDWPDAVAAYFRALDDCHDRMIDVINGSPIDLICFGDNVHSGTLPPSLFERYYLPSCQRRCQRLHAGNKWIIAHWDGDTGPLLPYARETGLDGIEAITPWPQGDVTLEQMKAGLGDKMFLVDGLPAIYFDDTFSVETLVECTHRLIELFAPKLVLGISDEISSTGDIERIRVVGQIVDEHNARFA